MAIVADISVERPSLAWLLVSGVGGALAAVIVFGTVAGRLGVPLGGPLFLGLVALGALPRLVALVRGRWEARLPELATLLVAFGVVFGIGLWLAWPNLLPPGRSVDSVLHFVLVRWIATHQALPEGTDANIRLLGEMAVYPPGLALTVMSTAALTLQPPITALYPTIALLGGLNAALVLLLATTAARVPATWRTTPLALVSTLLLLSHRTYTLGAYTDQNFYPMTLGMLLVLLAGCWLVAEPQPSTSGAAQLGLVIAALVETYPIWSPVPGVFAALAILLHGAPWRRKALHLALALGPAAVLGIVDVLPHLAIGMALLAHEGVVARPAPADLIPLALGLPGILLALLPGNRRARLLAGLAGLALGEGLALNLAARLGISAEYHSFKLLFVLTPLAAALAGAATITLAARLSRPAPRLAALGAVALILLVTGSLDAIPPPAEHPIDRNMVAAAGWIQANLPDQARVAITVGGIAGPQPYWLLVGLLGQDRDAAHAEVIATTPPTPESWIFDEHLPDIALGLNIDQPPPGTTALARFGRAAVLQRTGNLDAAELNPLVIRYQTFWEEERLKTAIKLLQPLPGRVPRLEIQLYQEGALINAFPLQPDPHRAKMQYLGADLLPATLGGMGYINTSDYPVFAPPHTTPAGALTLRLVLLLGQHVLDERLLATFEYTGDGRMQGIAPHSGELIYLRRPESGDTLRAGTWRFDDALLTGWAGPERAAAGAPVTLDLRWQTPALLDRPLLTIIQLTNTDGQVLAESVAAPQGGFYPTWRWRLGEAVTERRRLDLPPGLAPGTYRLVASVRDPAAGASDDTAQLGELVIER